MTKDEKQALRKRMYDLRHESVATRVKMDEAKTAGNKDRHTILRMIYTNRHRRELIFRKGYDLDVALHKGKDPEKIAKMRRQLEMMDMRSEHEIMRLQRKLGDIDQQEFDRKRKIMHDQALESRSRDSAARAGSGGGDQARAIAKPSGGGHQAKRSGKSVKVPPKQISAQAFMAIVRSVAKFAADLKKLGGGVGGEVKQKVYNWKSGASKFVVHTLVGKSGIVSLSAKLVTPAGEQGFSAKRSAL